MLVCQHSSDAVGVFASNNACLAASASARWKTRACCRSPNCRFHFPADHGARTLGGRRRQCTLELNAANGSTPARRRPEPCPRREIGARSGHRSRRSALASFSSPPSLIPELTCSGSNAASFPSRRSKGVPKAFRPPHLTAALHLAVPLWSRRAQRRPTRCRLDAAQSTRLLASLRQPQSQHSSSNAASR